MSAIAGLVMLDGSNINSDAIQNMLASLQHCGPDGRRFVQSGNTAFGQALLATTPEALNEVQPWTDIATGCVVVTDSRLDNRKILATSLGLTDRAIDTIGDAELIFAAHQKWGDTCPEKLLGDFAFAIWNPATRNLFCARDQLGIRPFYYQHIPGETFAFASSSEAIRLLSDSSPVFDEGRLADAMTDALEGYDRSSTFYRDIKRLTPATWLKLQKSTPAQFHSYWQPLQNPPSPFPGSEKQWLEQLEALFVEAVHCRLRSHLSISSMLSGGLDSSAIVAVACKKLAQDNKPILSTFSAISSAADCAETRAIRLMQATFTLNACNIDPEKSVDVLEAIVARWSEFDEPFEASITLVHAQYLRAQQNNQRIMLDGLDADSLFSEGGNYLNDLASNRKWRQLWREARGSLRFWGQYASLFNILRPIISRYLIPAPIRQGLRALRLRFFNARQQDQALILPEFARQIDLPTRYQTLAANTTAKIAVESGHRAYSPMSSSYAVVGLERYHRLAHRYGVEPRHPFLDRRLVEFCAWLPFELRVREGYPKWALRQAMSEWLPEDIAWRRGKEHLGWLFNKLLWQQSCKNLVSPLLHAWLKNAASTRIQTIYQQQKNFGPSTLSIKENDIEALLRLAALNLWLNKHR